MRTLIDRGVKIFILTCAGSIAIWATCADRLSHTSINGINFKLTESNGEYEGICLSPKEIPPNNLEDVILDRMIKKAGMFYKLGLNKMGDSF